MAIDAASQAYHAGNPTAATALITDQRGAPRFSGNFVDIGAYQTIGTPNQQFVSEVYQALLQRQVDAAGLAYWTGLLAGMTREELVLTIEQSSEYRTTQVRAAYQQFLRRDADADGLAHFVAFLADGGTIDEVDQALLSSKEYFQTQGGSTSQGLINALFRDWLGRPADAATLAWFNSLDGITDAQLVATVYDSQEHLQDVVGQLYQQFLDRPADAAGLSAFVGLLQSGGSIDDVTAAILGSSEYFAKVT